MDTRERMAKRRLLLRAQMVGAESVLISKRGVSPPYT